MIPPWRGEALAGKTILLYSELGFGDEILSLRFAKPVKDMGARVIISVRSPIVRLARSLAFVDAVVRQYGPAAYECVEILQCDQPPRKPDYVCALLAVPMFMRGADSGADQLSGELAAAKGLQTAYSSGGGCRDRYLGPEFAAPKMAQPAKLNVGICWASGGGNQQFAERKSIPLHRMASLARPGVNLVSLQLEHNDDLSKLGVIDAMAGVNDFADTAGIVDQLDLVITVDTALAHLAGALGKPVWNLLRSDATSVWPWFWDVDATPWYRSMTLYRQSRPGDWGDPLNRMFADFNRFTASV
ncbi:glycosyltransferase family 9 protein [Bradyrhizobium sp. 8-10B]|uniref:glycosyltransferase family 9 protein n=1 Tax=Bradyrhizobium sp. 8-10B TaxID=3344579 RepID=UPI0035C1092C